MQDELFDTIENYLNEGMSESERLAFEDRISKDPSLSDKVAEVRAANEAIYYASLADLKSTIGKDLKNITYKQPINRKKNGAISILVLALIAGLTVYFSTKNISPVKDLKPAAAKGISTVEKNTATEKASGSSETGKPGTAESADMSAKAAFPDTIATKKSDNTKQYTIDSLTKKNTVTENKNSVSSNTIVQPKQTDLNISKNEGSVQDQYKIPCDKTFKINTEASCQEKQNGSISIVSDGAYVYTFQTDIKSIRGSKAVFTDLSAGTHEILVTYGKECTYTKKVSVNEKWCALNEAYSFNPDYNEKWKPVYESGSSGTILIYDKQGKEIFAMPFGSGNEEWIGNDKHGMSVAVGLYIAFIQYADGRKEKVELTVIR